MKRIPCILLLFAFLMAGTSSLFAKTALEGERSTIFDALRRSGLGKGEVVINQSAAIGEMVAFRKEKEIKELFPEIPTYVTYNAPFWKLRVGDFRSHEEAYHMMRLLMGAFPKYGKEMYIVREEIKIPLN